MYRNNDNPAGNVRSHRTKMEGEAFQVSVSEFIINIKIWEGCTKWDNCQQKPDRGS